MSVLQPYMRTHTILTLHTEGDIFVLCQAGNVWVEYIINSNLMLCSRIFWRTAYNLSRNLSPIENSIGDGEI